jgi:tRNA pseudouridine55 synthase
MANLAQLRMLEDLSGFLLVDKPAGISFSTVVKTVKRKFNLVKVGHGGSLDTAATGLLVLLINDANKFTGDVMGADRAFTGTMRLGVKTDTHDIHGRKLSVNAVESAHLEKINDPQFLRNFKGDVFQTESRFCSVRREGSAEYEVVDTGDHPQFMSHVYRLVFVAGELPRVNFEITGTKSLLVKTLINDIGDELGCGAVLESLRRIKVGKFDVADAIAFDKLLETEMKDFALCVKPLSAILR